MENNNLKNQHLFLGRILFDIRITSLMNLDSNFHNYVYSRLMLHETGECERRIISKDRNQKKEELTSRIISIHIHSLSGHHFSIETNLVKSVTSVYICDQCVLNLN